MFLLGTVTALAAGSRAGTTQAAKRHTIADVKRFGVDLRRGRPRSAVLGHRALALEVLRLRQRRPMNRDAERDLLVAGADLSRGASTSAAVSDVP
jgi:hypothetical protein